MQLQFALTGNGVQPGLSCDPRNRPIIIIIPKVNLAMANNYTGPILFPTNVAVFNSQTQNLTESVCKVNYGIGISHSGGMGQLPDYNLEYRPLSAWGQSLNGTNIENVFGFTGSGNSYQFSNPNFLNSVSNQNLIQTLTREGIPSNQYRGLVMRFQKQCPNSTNLTDPNLSINEYI
jgi:hypothetical protein